MRDLGGMVPRRRLQHGALGTYPADTLAYLAGWEAIVANDRASDRGLSVRLYVG